MSSEQENQEQQTGIAVELVVKKLDEKKVYPLKLEFIPNVGDTIELGEAAMVVEKVKYKEENGAFIPVIEIIEK
jgi:hypothetical protein